MGSDFSFTIHIKEGAGAFVCGEETALIASIEGERGMPRPKPPFPANKGLFGRPTLINNVETLANVPLIILNGADWFASMGCESSKGTKTFALTGEVNNTGLIEVPMGTTLRQIIFDIGGGEFDHHQVNSPVRHTGIKYSSVGLIWKKYGRKLLKKKGVSINSINAVWSKIDQDFIQAIDASDNKELKSNFPNFCISKLIANFNPIWDLEEESNNCFMKAFQITIIFYF